MRGALIAVLVFIVGAIVTLVLERVVKDASEWIWRFMYGAVVIGPVVIILLSDPCYGYLGEFRKHAFASTLIVAVAAAIVVGTIWLFGIIGFPSSKSYLAGTKNAEKKPQEDVYASPTTSTPLATPSASPDHTTENVDVNVINWIKAFPDNFPGGKIKENQRPEVYFGYHCIFADGYGVAVSRGRDKRWDHFIGIGASILMDDLGQAAYNQLSPDKKYQFIRDLGAEAFRARMNIDSVDPSRPMILNHVIPVNDKLTEEVFYDALTNIHSDMRVLMATMDKLLMELSRAATHPTPKGGSTTQPSPTPNTGASQP